MLCAGLRDHFDFVEFYLADLDAIAGQLPSLSLFTQLQDKGFRLWVDAGIGTGLTYARPSLTLACGTSLPG